jgi:general secretion pathway protein D
MEQVEQKRSQYLDTARDQTRATMLREVDEMWEQKVPATGIENIVVTDTSTNPAGEILMKMQRIRFPKVSFAGATIDEAIEFLRVKSKDLDIMENNPEKKGVNIILKAGDTPISAQITLDLTDVPMAEALKYVTELASMKFKVEPYAVLVVPLSEVSASIVCRRTF